MNEGINGLIAKLILLGNRVDKVNDELIKCKNYYSNMETLVQLEGNKVIVSTDYDSVDTISNTGYSVVCLNGRYGLAYNCNQLTNSLIYKQMSSIVEVGENKYQLVATFDKNLYGIIDLEDNNIIPFDYNEIDVYKTLEGVIYVCKRSMSDYINIIDTRGNVCGISSIGVDYSLIIMEDSILIKGTDSRYSSYRLNGEKVYKDIEEIELIANNEYKLLDINDNVLGYVKQAKIIY